MIVSVSHNAVLKAELSIEGCSACVSDATTRFWEVLDGSRTYSGSHAIYITLCSSAARASFHQSDPGTSGNGPEQEGCKWRAIRSKYGNRPTLPKTESWHPRHKRCSLQCSVPP